VPDMRPVGDHFKAEADRLGVHLAIPARKAGEANFQANGAKANQNLRYLQEGALVKDETSGTNEQPLAYAKAICGSSLTTRSEMVSHRSRSPNSYAHRPVS